MSVVILTVQFFFILLHIYGFNLTGVITMQHFIHYTIMTGLLPAIISLSPFSETLTTDLENDAHHRQYAPAEAAASSFINHPPR